jgi:hypothetical protein
LGAADEVSKKSCRNDGTVLSALTTQHSDQYETCLMTADRSSDALKADVSSRGGLRCGLTGRLLKAGGVLLLVGFFSPLQAAFFSGRDLQVPLREIREGQPLTVGQMQALGYVQGVYDANAGLLFCSREGVDAGEVVKTVNAYLLSHPGLLEQPASVGLTAAMIAQWPCRRRG